MKEVPQYEGLYSISKDGRIYSHINNKYLVATSVNGWYPQIKLCKDGRQQAFKIHRLVAIAYIPNPENKKDVNHKNGIKTDNRVENLEWSTRSENIKHSFRTLKREPIKGFDHPKCKYLLDLSTGIFYGSTKEASIVKNIDRDRLKNGLRRGRVFMNLSYT